MTKRESRPGGEAAINDRAGRGQSIEAADDSRLQSLVDEGGMVAAALEWASHGWPVFPTRAKVPAILGAHRTRVRFPTGCTDSMEFAKDPLYGRCQGGCGRLGHGVWDATTDPKVIREMWSGARWDCTVSCRIPDIVAYLDIDPRHGGDQTWARILAAHGGDWPACETHISGRGDGGVHLFTARPHGDLENSLGPGVEFKHHGAAAVLPPSIHDVSGEPYTRIAGPIPVPPDWFVRLVVKSPTPRPTTRRWTGLKDRPSVADAYCESASWHDVLEPHGWECVGLDGDEEGARWRHPDATSYSSASVHNGSLYVFSDNTPFEQTAGSPRGYSKFAAYAVVNHGGDMKAAARELRQSRKGAE